MHVLRAEENSVKAVWWAHDVCLVANGQLISNPKGLLIREEDLKCKELLYQRKKSFEQLNLEFLC